MPIVLQLPEVKREKEERPTHCPYCKGEIFQRWGLISRQIKDTKVRTVKVPRYKCTCCKRTFRFYPEGVHQAQQSERLKRLCVIMWSLGLSHRSVTLILSAFGVNLSHMSGWRDVQQEDGVATDRAVPDVEDLAHGLDVLLLVAPEPPAADRGVREPPQLQFLMEA